MLIKLMLHWFPILAFLDYPIRVNCICSLGDLSIRVFCDSFIRVYQSYTWQFIGPCFCIFNDYFEIIVVIIIKLRGVFISAISKLDFSDTDITDLAISAQIPIFISVLVYICTTYLS